MDIVSMAKKIRETYKNALKPVATELNMSHMALEILMYLSDYPDKNTSGDICNSLCLKSAIVSFHVENLVNDGYLDRLGVNGDRRKYALIVTDRAKLVIEKAQACRSAYAKCLNKGLNPEDITRIHQIFLVMDNNLNLMKERSAIKSQYAK